MQTSTHTIYNIMCFCMSDFNWASPSNCNELTSTCQLCVMCIHSWFQCNKIPNMTHWCGDVTHEYVCSLWAFRFSIHLSPSHTHTHTWLLFFLLVLFIHWTSFIHSFIHTNIPGYVYVWVTWRYCFNTELDGILHLLS